jgi:BirA family biotin operon repressor/biotin-[acetyl-CoA-carboxylase] ligase
VPKLADWGLEVTAVPGVGYRLARAIDLLDADSLRAALPPAVGPRLGALDVLTTVGSTNRHLAERRQSAPARLDVCIAEYQHAGRGRRGRSWSTPLGAGLCLSVAWQFGETPPEIAALTLAVGVAARRALARVARVEVLLKWPNDLVFDHRKLGGILLELSAEAQGGCRVVAGIGINVALPAPLLARLSDWPRGAVDLASAAGGKPPPRAALAAALIAELAELFADYETTGFVPFRAEWRAADYLKGRAVALHESGGVVAGMALGIEADGALIVETAPGERRRVISGDVSVRAAS